MHIYVALLRGIGPTNPNMHPKKLKGFFEGLGLKNVATVIASGNVVFESQKRAQALEALIEKELPKKLKFSSTTIIRSQQELEKLVKKNPFKGIKDEKPNYLIVTFFKSRRPELCTVIDTSASNGANFMAALEKKHSKAITTRTYKTVHRILAKMSAR